MGIQVFRSLACSMPDAGDGIATREHEHYERHDRPKGPETTPLPPFLRRERTIDFDGSRAAYDLNGAACALLQQHPSLGQFGATEPLRLEEFAVRANVFRNFKARQVLYRAVANDAHLLSLYERLVHDVVLPRLKDVLVAVAGGVGVGEGSEAVLFHYQYPPTMRLQPGPSQEHGRTHADAEYGHQPGELNCWLPLTDPALTQTTLWVESEPGDGSFHPLEVGYGAIAVFHGVECRHYAPPNPSGFTRVSLDFRIGIGGHFDPQRVDPTVKAQHTWRCVSL